MDLVRYYLAVSVIIAHFNLVFDKQVSWPTSSGSAVGIFFGFSGFLVYASYLRHGNLRDFVRSRAKRIVPAYGLAVIASALLLSLLSSLSLGDYFSDDGFWKYLAANLTFLNFLQPDLPGVFTANHISAVNGSLWTLKVEWMLYLSVPLFFLVCRKVRISKTTVILLLFLFSLIYSNVLAHISTLTGQDFYYRLSYQFAGQFVYFYTGVLLFIHKPWLMTHKLSALGIGMALFATDLAITQLSDGLVASLMHELLFPIAVVTIFLVASISKAISPKVAVLGNCSYEMYLFHFPILQSLACAPAFRTLPTPWMLGLSLLLIYTVALLVNRLTTSIWAHPQKG